MTSFRTVFFKWQYLNGVWVAKDPVDKDQTWIIQPSAAHYPAQKYELAYTFGIRQLQVDWHDNPIYLAWLAVSKKIDTVATQLSQLHYLIPEDQTKALNGFLKSLTFPLPKGVQDEADVVSNPGPTENLERKVPEPIVPNQ